MSRVLYPALLSLQTNGRLTPAETNAAIAATAEGYAYPTNLDTDPPVGGLAPLSQAEIFRQALSNGTSPEEFDGQMNAWESRRTP